MLSPDSRIFVAEHCGLIGSAVVRLLQARSATFTSASDDGWSFNSTHANGPDLQIRGSGSAVLHLGSQKGVTGSGDAGVGYIQGPSGNFLNIEAGTSQAIRSATITGSTTASVANMVIESDTVRRSTSSARYKTNIEPLKDWRWLLDLESVTFNSKTETDGGRFGAPGGKCCREGTQERCRIASRGHRSLRCGNPVTLCPTGTARRSLE